jgi:hypothetical protein
MASSSDPSSGATAGPIRYAGGGPTVDPRTFKQHIDTCERNQGPIGDVIAKYVLDVPSESSTGTDALAVTDVNALEVASGTGQHAVAFVTRFQKRRLVWQASDMNAGAVRSCEAYRSELSPEFNLQV